MVQRHFHGGIVVASFFENLKPRSALVNDAQLAGRAAEARCAVVAEYHGHRPTIGHKILGFKILGLGLAKMQG